MMSLDEALANRPIPFDKIEVARLTGSAVKLLCVRCGGAISFDLSMVDILSRLSDGRLHL